MSVFSATALLFLVLDPLGNVPLFTCALSRIDRSQHHRIILRELLIALGILVVFLFAGRQILDIFAISESSLGIAGGIILFMIAIKMVFPGSDTLFDSVSDEGPFIVPLAVPLVAGPSSIVTVMLLMAHEPSRWPEWLFALSIAWLGSGVLLIFSGQLSVLLGDRVLKAIERLMGMILTAVAVEMLVSGILKLCK